MKKVKNGIAACGHYMDKMYFDAEYSEAKKF